MLLTQCPRCAAIYRLGAATLSAAAGFVRCGECGTEFNALYRLTDDPGSAAPRAPAAETSPPPTAAAELEFTPRTIPAQARVPLPAVRAVPEADAPPTVRHAPLRDADPRRASPAEDAALDLNEVPAVLREDVARLLRGRRFGARGLWTLLLLAAVLALAAQLAIETRARWLARYPRLAPHATHLCAWLGCAIDARRARTGIELVARDVREHPRYAHALLVNATLANRGDGVIEYPVIQLGIHDRNGGVVGVRRFAPHEYLDASIDIRAGLRAHRAIYVVLEIASAGDAAESFEFKFL
jgi:predicted Zn finger-like uncharacterized protein